MTSIALPALQPIETPASRRIVAIDGLRAIAVLMVLLHHALLAPLFMGVDLFFVISGFLITGILLERKARCHGPACSARRTRFAPAGRAGNRGHRRVACRARLSVPHDPAILNDQPAAGEFRAVQRDACLVRLDDHPRHREPGHPQGGAVSPHARLYRHDQLYDLSYSHVRALRRAEPAPESADRHGGGPRYYLGLCKRKLVPA